MAAPLAEVTRGSLVESTHLGHVVVMASDGSGVAVSGDPDARVYFRSSAKPFQAVPLLATGAAAAFGLTTEEIALSCASHNGTERHQTIVRSMLAKAGLVESNLRCGISPPLDETEKARVTLGLVPESQVQCECSGEHAGMLLACRHAGWSIDDYVRSDHPVQREIREIVAAGCGLPADALDVATDGCSIPTFGAPVSAFAFAYAVLAYPEGARWDGASRWGDALLRVRDAMTRHPELVSGDGETDTTIMEETEGRVVAKLGAEGLLCLAIPEVRTGVAISDTGGSPSGLGPAAVAVLRELQLEEPDTLQRLETKLCSPVQSFKGEPVGEVRSALRLVEQERGA